MQAEGKKWIEQRRSRRGALLCGGDLGIHIALWHSCGCYFDTYRPHKHWCRPHTPHYGNSILWWQGPLPAGKQTVLQCKKNAREGFKEHNKWFETPFRGLVKSMPWGQSCFCCTMETYTILRQVVAVYSDRSVHLVVCSKTVPPSEICNKSCYNIHMCILSNDLWMQHKTKECTDFSNYLEYWCWCVCMCVCPFSNSPYVAKSIDFHLYLTLWMLQQGCYSTVVLTMYNLFFS